MDNIKKDIILSILRQSQNKLIYCPRNSECGIVPSLSTVLHVLSNAFGGDDIPPTFSVQDTIVSLTTPSELLFPSVSKLESYLSDKVHIPGVTSTARSFNQSLRMTSRRLMWADIIEWFCIILGATYL